MQPQHKSQYHVVGVTRISGSDESPHIFCLGRGREIVLALVDSRPPGDDTTREGRDGVRGLKRTVKTTSVLDHSPNAPIRERSKQLANGLNHSAYGLN